VCTLESGIKERAGEREREGEREGERERKSDWESGDRLIITSLKYDS